MGVEVEEEGNVVNASSGSSRARLAAGGDVGGDRIGSRGGVDMIVTVGYCHYAAWVSYELVISWQLTVEMTPDGLKRCAVKLRRAESMIL